MNKQLRTKEYTSIHDVINEVDKLSKLDKVFTNKKIVDELFYSTRKSAKSKTAYHSAAIYSSLINKEYYNYIRENFNHIFTES
jgi:hypothetical protein